jgi:predicted amidohydrolase
MNALNPIRCAWVTWLGLTLVTGAEAPKPLAHFRHFADSSATHGAALGWAPFAPRAEIAPRCSVDAQGGRTGLGALKIEAGGNAAAFGGWRRSVAGVTGGRTYRLTAWYRAQDVPHERRSITARLEWLDAKEKSVRPPDYAIDVLRDGAWTKVEYLTQAPDQARRVELQLSLGFTAQGQVWWDDIQLVEEPNPPQRVVRAVTVFHRPRDMRSSAESVASFCRLVEEAGPAKPDLICLPEGITVVGTGKSYADVSEPVPGPTTRTLGELAKKLRSYLVAGLYERSGNVVYNTAVLVGRSGELIGSYRKTHLPREEWEAGVTPGDAYPVFETDFGKVGLIICWDLHFPEPARAMALKGAEVLLLPIWGGSEVLARARAIENHVFLVSSTYDMRSFIVDPTGAILAEATKDQPVASAELDLDRVIQQPWLGDMKTRTWKERRPDLPIE